MMLNTAASKVLFAYSRLGCLVPAAPSPTPAETCGENWITWGNDVDLLTLPTNDCLQPRPQQLARPTPSVARFRSMRIDHKAEVVVKFWPYYTMAEGSEEANTISLTVKTAKDKQQIEIAQEGTVKELREIVSKKFNTSHEQVCLIFAGKILKDDEKLSQHNIKDGFTVHLVIKSPSGSAQPNNRAASTTPAATTAPTSSTSTQQTTPNPFAGMAGLGGLGLGGLGGLGNLGVGNPNFHELQQHMQREILNNPEMMRQIMDNPFVQQLMNNPEYMRAIITSNPHMQQLMERNPEISHMLNNPDMLRQTMELARNPAMLQELMRSHDRALSNLESIPGGYSALQRMYRDIQEPMLNAAQEQFGSNPFASLLGNSANIDSAQAGRENSEPLPNPWAPRSSSTTTTTTTSPSSGKTPTTTTSTTASNNTTSTTSTTTTSSTSSSSTTMPGMGGLGLTGMLQSPGMQSLMQQMMENPQLLSSMINAPYTRAMFQNLASNPDLAQQIIGSNPLFAGNPVLQEQMRTMLPSFLNQMQNPEVQNFMTNPQALAAVVQIQNALEQLRLTSPGLFNVMGLNLTQGIPTAGQSTTTTTATTSSSSTTTASTNSTNTTTSTTPAPPLIPGLVPGTDAFANLMSTMSQALGSGGGGGGGNPEQQYASQLEQLSAMGFINREANLQGVARQQLPSPLPSAMASPALLLPPLLLLLLLLLISAASADGFRVGFERWPSSEVVAVPGTEVRLPCSTNDTADKISWKFNSHFLHAPSSGTEYAVPEGFQVVAVQGGSELVVRLSESEAQYADQTGLYQCVAWFGPIALTSLPGNLQAAVLRAPEGEAQQEEVQVVEGGAVRVECEVPYSIPEAVLTFYRDGTLLDLTDKAYQQTPHGDLLVMGVGMWAEGVYTCHAHNEALGRGVTLPTATRVKVLPRAPALPVAPPVFVSFETVYSGHAGTNLTLPCLANGNPKPVVRWSRYGTALPSGASQGPDGSLQLSSVAVEDAGAYLCHATNDVGKEKILHVSVEVVEPPSITRAPQSQRVEEGEALTLHCRARGHPQPRVMWVFNGEVVLDYGNIAITNEGLVIRAVQKEHAGIFQCFAHNPEGAVQGVAMVSVVPRTVTAVPGATHTRPDHIPDAVGPRRKNVQDGDSSGGSGGRGVRKGRKGSKRKKTEREGDLSLHGGGKMRKGGKGNRKKGRMVPPSVPHITKVSDESVMVSWEGPPESQSLPILFYKIQYKLVRNREHQGSHWMTADENIPPHITTYEVTGLQTGRVYRFRIAAVYTNNDNLLGPTSRRFLLEEDSNTQRPEEPPTIISLQQETPTLVRVRWSYNPTPGIPVEGFFIHYRESTVAGSYTKVTVLDPEKREHVVSHLKANTSYDFKMQCFNMAGRSNFSKALRNIAPGHSASTTQKPQEGEVEAREQVPVVREGEPSSLSSTHLYIILGAALGLLLLIVVVSASVYTCRNKHSDDDTRSVKYEDTSLHIHRETSTYSLPQTPRGKGPNGYLPHQGITITAADDEKAVMETSVTENNNHSTRQVSRCFTSPARRIASEDGCVDMGVKTLAITKATYDTGPPPSPPLSTVESSGKEYAYQS